MVEDLNMQLHAFAHFVCESVIFDITFGLFYEFISSDIFSTR